MNASLKLDRRTLNRDRNIIAALLSILPGLGHVYKGEVAAGLVLMFFALPMTIWAGLLLALATAGLGLLVPVAFVGFVALDAFYLKDHRKHRIHELL